MNTSDRARPWEGRKVRRRQARALGIASRKRRWTNVARISYRRRFGHSLHRYLESAEVA